MIQDRERRGSKLARQLQLSQEHRQEAQDAYDEMVREEVERYQEQVRQYEEELKRQQEERTRAENAERENAAKTQVKTDMLVNGSKNKQGTSERSAETQVRTKSKDAAKKSSVELPSWEETLDKWAPSWKKKGRYPYSGDVDKIVKETEWEMNRPIELATANGTELSSRVSQAKAMMDELDKLKADYEKRRKALENQKNQVSASIVGTSPSVGVPINIGNKIDEKIAQLDDDYRTKVDMIRNFTSRNGISASSFNKLASERYKDDIALVSQLKDQHEQMLKDPNVDKAELRSLATRIRNLDRKNEARNNKLNLIEKYIRVHGFPKSIEDFPEYLRDTAADVFSEDGTLDNGVLAPSVVSERGKYIRELNLHAGQAVSATNANEQAVRLKEQILNEMRIIEEAHGIPAKWADWQNLDENADIFSTEGVLNRYAYGIRNLTKVGQYTSRAFQAMLGVDVDRYNNLTESLHTIDKALRYQELNDKFYKDSDKERGRVHNEATNLWKQFVIDATKISTWDFGISDLKKAMMLSDIRDVQDKGGVYTKDQQDLLNAMALEAVLHDKYGEYESAFGVQAASTFAQSLPFMLDMVIGSHGLAAAAKATEKQGVKQAVKFLTGELGKSIQKRAMREAIEQYGVHGVEAAIARNVKQVPGLLTRLSGDAVNALLLSNTVQGAKTASDILELHNGLIDYKIGEDGTVTGEGFKNALDWGEAIRQAEIRAWIENFSEALGEYDIFTNMFKPLTRKAVKLNYWANKQKELSRTLGVNAVSKNAIRTANIITGTRNLIDWTKNHNPFAGTVMRDFLHSARYHGAVGESLEEYYGLALEHAFNVSDSGKSFWEDITDSDTFWDIVGGIALSQVVLGTAGGAHVLTARTRYKYAQNRAAKHFGENWEAMENAIVNASSENVASIVSRLANTAASTEDKQMLFDYYTELMAYRGSSYAEQAEQKKRDSSNHAKAVRDSYQTGYMTNAQNARNDLDRAINAAKQNLNQAFGIDDIDQTIEDNGGVDELANRLDDQNLISVLLGYDNMLAARDGMMQRYNDDLDIMLQQAEHDVMRLRYRGDGRNKIVSAQLKNGQTVFITNGLEDDSETVIATGFNGERFNLDKEQLAEDKNGRYIVDEYDAADFINSQKQQILKDYMERDDRRSRSNWELRTGTTIDLSSGGTMTILGTARDGGVLYSIREGDKETTLKAESTSRMIDLIRDANNERQNAILERFITEAAKESRQAEMSGSEEVEITDESAQEIADQMNRRIEETMRKPTEYIPSGRRGASEQEGEGFIPNRGNAQKTYNNAVNAIRYAKDAKDFTEFTQKLERAGFAVSFQYGGRLQTLYKAFQSGAINEKELALAFIPNEERKNVAGKKTAKRFDSLEFDSEGNVISSRKPKKASNKPVESTSTEEPAIVPVEEEKPVVEPETTLPPAPEGITENPDGSFSPTPSIVPPTPPTTPIAPSGAEESPAPESTTAGAVEASDKALHNNPQQDAIDALVSKIAEDKGKVRVDLRTGHDYFIEVDGKLVMYRRVHSVLDPQYPDRPSKIKNRQTYLNKLRAARTDMKKWEKLVREFADEHNKNWPNEEPVRVDTYIQYIKDNPSEIADVEESVAELCSNEDTHISVKYGNIMDSICRIFFSDALVPYQMYAQFMSEDTFNEILRQLMEIKEVYDARGWKLITDPCYLYSELQDKEGKITRVAGETDMIAVDKDGKYHIIDFKTSYSTFVPRLVGNTMYDRFSQALPTIDSRTSYPRNAKRTYRQQYSNQLTVYSVMLDNNTNGNVGSISLLPWHIGYDPHSDDVQFDSATNFEDTGKPVLIELDRSNDVLNTFSKPSPADTEKTEEANAAAQAQIDALSDVLADNNDSVTDDVKNAAAELIEAQNKAVEVAQSTDDPKVHENAQREAEQNAAEAQQLRQEAEQQATAAAQLEIANDAEQARRDANQELQVDDWTQHTVTHTNNLDDSYGIEDAVAINDASKKLSVVTGEKDFVTNGKFVFGTTNINGQIKLTVQVTYKGVTYQPVTISTARNDLGRKFYGKVMQALRKAKPGQVVVPTVVRRTSGEIKFGESGLLTRSASGRKPLVSAKQGEGEVYLYDVQLGPQFGMVVRQGSMYTAVIPGINGGQNQPTYMFRSSVEGLAGTYVMILDRGYEEPGSQNKAHVYTRSARMTEGDADLIIDILQGRYTIDGSKNLNQKFIDNNVDYGLTNLQVLNLLLPFGQQNGAPRLHIEYDNLSDDAIRIVGRVAGSDIDNRVFYLNTETGRQALKDFLTSSVNKELSNTVMHHRLGKRGQSPFNGLLDFLNSASGQQMLKQKKQIQFGKSSIIFDLDDFKDPNNPNDKQGLTGLGWYIKRGFIETPYDGFGASVLDFDNTADVRIEDDSTPPAPPVQQVVNDPVSTNIGEAQLTDDSSNALTDRLDYDDVAMDWDMAGFDKRVSRNQRTGRTIKEDQARRNLEKIFGENGVKVEFVDNVIAMMRRGVRVVGRCYADSIILSKKADAGVEYHEAFHRVVELLLSEKQRAKVYAAFRNAKKGRSKLTDKQIAEALADNFMYFMMNKPTFKFTFNLKKMFGQISDWVKMLNSIGSLRLTYLYLTTANGRFRNVQPTKEAKERFKAFAKHGLNFTKRGTDLPNILNEHHYRTLVKSLTYLFMNPSTQRIEWTGANITELRVDKELAMQSAIWKQWMDPIGTKNGEPVYRTPYETRIALQELMDNWDAVRDDIASHITQFSADYKVRYEEQNKAQLDTAVPEVNSPQDADGTDNDDDPASAGAEAVDGHIKASYEFNPFSRTSDKVKFFFAGIPDYTLDSNGNKRPVLNECGLQQLIPATQVYARMLNDLHTVTGVDDLRKQLHRLGQKNYMYQIIARRFDELWDAVVPEKGKEVDYDAEQLIAQITQTVRQNKNVFEIAKTRKDKKGFTVNIIASDSGYTAMKFTQDWGQQFAAGAGLFIKQNEKGDFVMKNGMTPYVFTELCKTFNGPDGMIQALSPINNSPKPFKINGVEIDINNPAHIEMCKNYIVRTLRWFGINFEKDALDYTLMQQYQDTGANGIYSFLTDNKYGGFSGFLNFIAYLNYNGTLNISKGSVNIGGESVDVSKAFSKIGFLTKLADYKYAYRHSFDQLSVLATGSKTFYVMSENNFLTDRLFEIQNDPNELASMKADPYIQFTKTATVGEDQTYGSLVVEHITNNGGNLEVATLIGFSSSEAGLDDVDYAQMSAREDYISKFSALLSGRMIFPTQSDKKTWGYVRGLMLPGLDFSNLLATMPTKKGRIVNDEVLDRLIGYAVTEDAAISRFLAEKDSIPEEEQVENYDGGTTVTEKLANGQEVKHKVLQGGRFSALLGVWDGDTFIEFNRLFDENGVYQTEEMCQQRAHEYFFDKSIEEQRDIMNTILLKQTEQELQYICELGLINGMDKQKPTDSNMLAYKNVGLDYQKIDAVARLLASMYNTSVTDGINRTALMMVVVDVVAKGIVSMNEYERVFCGQPSFFKFKYDSDGHLVNRTDDQSKRLGGLVSTGFNNVMLPGIKEDYVCAEVSDEKVSEQNIEEIHKLTYEGTVRQTYLRYRLAKEGVGFKDVERAKEIADEVDNMSIKEIEDTFDDTVKAIINKSVDAKVGAFKKINVTDGASYISEQMCENLLRMAGSFNGDVKRAFDMLTGKKVNGKVYTTKDIRELAQAYQTVLTSVIGAQKYTAYGFRERPFTDASGNTTITHVPYYNKTALFPLFKSIATGPLADFYQKMQDAKIDMVMMHSAVKVGGQGQVPVKWDDLDNLSFNTYTQKYKYIRKQFNTDPKEKEEMSIGTQTKKVALSTLTPGRTYVVGEESLSADQVRDRIMDSLNAMSDLGEATLKEMFFTDGQFDVEKFSKLLTKELVGRGASAEMIDAVSVENGKLKVPLAALSGMNWIQSIIKSMIDKRVVDTNTPGKAFYQRSVWGMEGVSILDDDNIPPTINSGKPLQVKNEEGSMDVVLSIDYFEDVLKQAKVKTGKKVKKTRKVKKSVYDTYEKYGVKYTDYTKTHDVEVEEEYETDEYISVSQLSFEEQRQWLIDHNIIGGPQYDENDKPIPSTGASANIIGYRIPTQAVSSIHAMRCVDVLPVVRDTIIMPKAITSITGSDKQYHCSNQSNIKNPFNCGKLSMRRPAAKTLLYYVSRVRFND